MTIVCKDCRRVYDVEVRLYTCPHLPFGPPDVRASYLMARDCAENFNSPQRRPR